MRLTPSSTYRGIHPLLCVRCISAAPSGPLPRPLRSGERGELALLIGIVEGEDRSLVGADCTSSGLRAGQGLAVFHIAPRAWWLLGDGQWLRGVRVVVQVCVVLHRRHQVSEYLSVYCLFHVVHPS